MSCFKPRVQFRSVLVDDATRVRVVRVIAQAGSNARARARLGISEGALESLSDRGTVSSVLLAQVVARLDEIDATEGPAAE